MEDKVVIDTNVIISAFINPKGSYYILHNSEKNSIHIVLSTKNSLI